MSWSTPTTWATGDWVTAGVLNASLKENLEYLYGTGTSGWFTARFLHNQTMGENDAFRWSTVAWDPTGWVLEKLKTWPLPWQMVATPPGYHLLTLQTTTPASAVDEARVVRMYDYENGVDFSTGGQQPGGGATAHQGVSAIIRTSGTLAIEAGDYSTGVLCDYETGEFSPYYAIAAELQIMQLRDL